MSASFNLILDTQAPANPTILINGGAAATGDRAVWVTLSTSDYAGGANDVAEVKIWGDVDPTSNPALAVLEADAGWVPFAEQVAVMLSPGSGRKYLYARLRDDVGNESLPFTDFVDFDIALPTVSITTAVDRDRISKVPPHHAATFTWQSNAPFVAYAVRAVPSHGSPHQAGVAIGSSGGSVNVTGATPVAASTLVVTTITGTDLAAASPGDTPKIIKVFVQNASGVWSA